MTIRPRGQVYEVAINRASALKGYNRIRKTAATIEAAQALEAEIEEAIKVYGKWPVEAADQPLLVRAEKGLATSTVERQAKAFTRRSGTLREASKLALQTHWNGTRYHDVVKYMVPIVVDFMEDRGKPDIDDIRSVDVDALVTWCTEQEHSKSTTSKYLGILRVINDVALKRLPPLCTIKIPTPTVTGKRIEKWWLRPEDHQKVTSALRDPLNGDLLTDALYADLIDIIVYQGLRVEEALRMEKRMFWGLDTPSPWFNPNGTKTSNAQNSIPVYPEALEPIKRAIERQTVNRWSLMFPLTPRQASTKWNDVREYLGVAHIPTATMKSLRRTFAWYANSRGMPTATLQKVLRHKGISTTAGYLDLVGGGDLERSREYFTKEAEPAKTPSTSIGDVIKAFAQIPGVTPEEVAKFAKELMS